MVVLILKKNLVTLANQADFIGFVNFPFFQQLLKIGYQVISCLAVVFL